MGKVTDGLKRFWHQFTTDTGFWKVLVFGGCVVELLEILTLGFFVYSKFNNPEMYKYMYETLSQVWLEHVGAALIGAFFIWAGLRIRKRNKVLYEGVFGWDPEHHLVTEGGIKHATPMHRDEKERA